MRIILITLAFVLFAHAAHPSLAACGGRSPAQLETLLDQYDKFPDPALVARIDAAAGQRDALWSRLFWYTDLPSAQAAARAQQKPILYLRLLGKLTDEYSCANSRYFRTVLYANAEVSQQLRENFILVWESERPVPVVTIDYGDGRTVKRTITGNSVHYVLDPDAHVIDALPGLLDPTTFAGALRDDLAYLANPGTTSPEARRARLGELRSQLASSWEDINAHAVAPVVALPSRGAPNARDAGILAPSKRRLELPILEKIEPGPGVAADPRSTPAWTTYLTLYRTLDPLDAGSLSLMLHHLGGDEAALERTAATFRTTIAEDTVVNNHILRPRILGWLVESDLSLEQLNARVYAEAFLTPRTDPWLGMVTPDTYSALCEAPATASPR